MKKGNVLSLLKKISSVTLAAAMILGTAPVYAEDTVSDDTAYEESSDDTEIETPQWVDEMDGATEDTLDDVEISDELIEDLFELADVADTSVTSGEDLAGKGQSDDQEYVGDAIYLNVDEDGNLLSRPEEDYDRTGTYLTEDVDIFASDSTEENASEEIVYEEEEDIDTETDDNAEEAVYEEQSAALMTAYYEALDVMGLNHPQMTLKQRMWMNCQTVQ